MSIKIKVSNICNTLIFIFSLLIVTSFSQAMPGSYTPASGDDNYGQDYAGRQRSGRCSGVPAEVIRVARGMIDLRNSCGALSIISNRNKPVMVADLSNDDGSFYVFSANGQCQRKITSNSWGHGGAGPRSDVDPEACSRGGSNLNPAGLHVTDASHNTAKFPSGTALLMRGLDGQRSEGRGVLIHGGHPMATSSSIGCNAMSDSDFRYCRDQAGGGALVYNYFGNNRPSDPSCRAGYRPNGGLPSCSSFTPHLLPPSLGGGRNEARIESDPLDHFFVPAIAKLFKIDSAQALGIVEYPIKSGTAIKVVKFDPELRLYEVIMVEQDAVGPNYADVKDLMKALGFSQEKIEMFKENPRNIFGAEYNLKENLELQNYSQIISRFPKYKLVEMKNEWERKKRLKQEEQKRRIESGRSPASN